jgi:hypothetical protein
MDIFLILALVCFAADAILHRSLVAAGLAFLVLAGGL